MRTDANRIALRAIRTILDGATSVSLKVQGKDVECSLQRRIQQAWPKTVADLDPSTDGPWPSNVDFLCKWNGGQCTLTLSAELGSGRYTNEVSLRAGIPSQHLIWTNVCRAIGDASDGAIVKPEAWIILTKRLDADLVVRMTKTMRAIAAEAGLPMGSQSKMLPCDVAIPGGDVLPSGEVAARRILHLALIKLDFMSRGERARARGRPLVDVETLVGAIPDNVDVDARDEEAEGERRPRRYWAGGFYWGDASKLEEFVAGSYWQLGHSASADEPAAKLSWRRLRDVTRGDWFAIKGYGGTHDLVVYFVGEVTDIDLTVGRVSLRRLDVPLYRGKAPRGAGGGNWFDTLVPITRPDAVSVLFATRSKHALPEDTPLNLILYGPPGTGKTYSLQEDYIPAFTGEPNESGRVDTPTHDFVFTTFHQSYSYEDFVEGIRPRLVGEGDDHGAARLVYDLQDGVFGRAVRAAVRLTSFRGTFDEFCRLPRAERERCFRDARPYAVFIDEINRGNVSRIFGELITLLEEDKRLGAENEIVVTLPYSRALFGVPRNLYVIGTMNTADRSVDALDTALRRRFAFQELAPRPELLSFPIEGSIDLVAMLQTINRRLEKLCDRDHRIGHAYFLPLQDDPSLTRLTQIMSRSVLPLLQEYFFGDWGKIGLVLGQ